MCRSLPSGRARGSLHDGQALFGRQAFCSARELAAHGGIQSPSAPIDELIGQCRGSPCSRRRGGALSNAGTCRLRWPELFREAVAEAAR